VVFLRFRWTGCQSPIGAEACHNQYQFEPDPVEMAERYGAAIPVLQWEKAVLFPCGNQEVDMVVRGTARRWLRRADDMPTPPDWCYVNNFTDPQKPRRLQLPPGRATSLPEAMRRLVEELRAALAAFERDDYQARLEVIDQQFRQRDEQAFGELQRRGEQKGIAMLRTPMGLAPAPRRDGKVLTPELFEALPEAERERIQHNLEDVQGELETVMQKVPQWEREHREAAPFRPTPPQHKSRGCVKRLTHLSDIGKLLVAPLPTAAPEAGADGGRHADNQLLEWELVEGPTRRPSPEGRSGAK